jgi:trigger factor
MRVDRPVVSDADVDAQIERMRDQFAELDDVGREGFDGDFVLVDVQTTVDGETRLAAGSANDLLYEIGIRSPSEGMDEALRGTASRRTSSSSRPCCPRRSGGRREAGRGAPVLVKKVKAKRLPELTDEWVDDVSEFETVDEMRRALRAEIQKVFDW